MRMIAITLLCGEIRNVLVHRMLQHIQHSERFLNHSISVNASISVKTLLADGHNFGCDSQKAGRHKWINSHQIKYAVYRFSGQKHPYVSVHWICSCVCSSNAGSYNAPERSSQQHASVGTWISIGIYNIIIEQTIRRTWTTKNTVVCTRGWRLQRFPAVILPD